MRSSLHRFGAVFWNEALLNSKRVAPYALMILFSANAVLWWSRGPAVKLGWATNSDFYIVRNLLGFSFLLGLPIFNAVIMGDPVIRDFRLGVDPLIFSKPVNRAQYLLGKFFGNFFVLVCCQAAFPLTLLVLQAFRTSQMVVQPVRVFPYFKHFFFFVVISHLVLAAIYFTVGTLTRNPKIVYGLAVCFYPLYISYGLFLLRPLPLRWRAMLDPMLLGSSLRGNGFLHSAEFLNQYVVRYTADMIANRVVMILVTALCLAILYLRFTMSERPGKVEKFSVLSLSTAAERVYYDSDSSQETHTDQFEKPDSPEKKMLRVIPPPEVSRVNEGIRANVNKLIAALGVEFRLLRAERSLVVIMPLAIFLSILEVAFYHIPPDVSYSAAYATNTAKLLLLLLIGIAVFYTGEAMHRDREVRIEPVLWAAPAPNNVFLLSKFLTTLLSLAGLIALVGIAGVAIQILRGHTPIDLIAYLRVYGIILLPGAVFVTAVSLLLNVVLRNKYLVYVVSIGTAAGLFYLYNLGYNHWLYNPALYGLWTYPSLIQSVTLRMIVWQRAYCVAISIGCLAVSHLLFHRKVSAGMSTGRLIDGRRWSLILVAASLTAAIISALVLWKT